MTEHRRRLEIDEDLRFQRREWRFQRVGWLALSAFVAAAALGLFGSGPLSGASAGGGGPLAVEYQRFVRLGAPTRILLRGQGLASDPDGTLALRMPRRYFEAIRIDRLVPEPEVVRIDARFVELRFAREAVAADFSLVLDVEPLEFGVHRGAFSVEGAPEVRFTQLAYF